eukprot:14616797-Alexandrium_andersonii.AAC.1
MAQVSPRTSFGAKSKKRHTAHAAEQNLRRPARRRSAFSSTPLPGRSTRAKRGRSNSQLFHW